MFKEFYSIQLFYNSVKMQTDKTVTVLDAFYRAKIGYFQAYFFAWLNLYAIPKSAVSKYS
jgi:hypothetical protein